MALSAAMISSCDSGQALFGLVGKATHRMTAWVPVSEQCISAFGQRYGQPVGEFTADLEATPELDCPCSVLAVHNIYLFSILYPFSQLAADLLGIQSILQTHIGSQSAAQI